MVYAEDNGGCYSDTINVDVLVADEISFNVTPGQIICPDSYIDLEVSDISGGYGLNYSVVWTYEDGSTSISDFISVSPDTTTTYCVTVIDACETPDVDSCITITPSGNIPVSFTIDSESASCPPFLATFTNTTDPSLMLLQRGTLEMEIRPMMNSRPIIYMLIRVISMWRSLLQLPPDVFLIRYGKMRSRSYPVPNPYFVMTPQIATLQNTSIDFSKSNRWR